MSGIWPRTSPAVIVLPVNAEDLLLMPLQVYLNIQLVDMRMTLQGCPHGINQPLRSAAPLQAAQALRWKLASGWTGRSRRLAIPCPGACATLLP